MYTGIFIYCLQLHIVGHLSDWQSGIFYLRPIYPHKSFLTCHSKLKSAIEALCHIMIQHVGHFKGLSYTEFLFAQIKFHLGTLTPRSVIKCIYFYIVSK